jgi:hypothetical protein
MGSTPKLTAPGLKKALQKLTQNIPDLLYGLNTCRFEDKALSLGETAPGLPPSLSITSDDYVIEPIPAYPRILSAQDNILRSYRNILESAYS